jgi:hypothetical protein
MVAYLYMIQDLAHTHHTKDFIHMDLAVWDYINGYILGTLKNGFGFN